MIGLVAAGAAMVPSTAQAAFPGGNGLIAYRGGDLSLDNPRIFSVRPDGSDTRSCKVRLDRDRP